METKYWSTVKEFQGVQLLRDPETLQCRIVPIERQQPQKPELQIKDEISPEVQARAEESFRLHCMTRDVGAKAAAFTPEPSKPMTFEEQVQHDWRCNPNICKEFTSLASYTAYMKAVRGRRAKIIGSCAVR